MLIAGSFYSHIRRSFFGLIVYSCSNFIAWHFGTFCEQKDTIVYQCAISVFKKNLKLLMVFHRNSFVGLVGKADKVQTEIKNNKLDKSLDQQFSTLTQQ